MYNNTLTILTTTTTVTIFLQAYFISKDELFEEENHTPVKQNPEKLSLLGV